MRPALVVAAVALFGAAPAQAQDLNFSIAPTQTCLAATADPAARRACAGKAAEACMTNNPGGETTVGMGYCLDQEVTQWDGWLNAAYGSLLSKAQASDADSAQWGTSAPKITPALREMQRKWIAYRDTTCDFEMSQWGGGSGTGPAGLNCLLRLTADQAIYLERAWLGE
ncbi:DUF1311 domain-containing protein [Ruegeria sp. 2012CJ41-6]|uniref:DUF1311 domain-containing protein n=1 Tax=Ruegeria spongiae TaxID=2942209 RepID=A0ABT0Q515_9RHOB|nr:lysozyme inhibitor LprI family protein [Ruegeria spongiae]MCL6283999.1 DUF1311 domain-containing protein [Ruegeria spongiae]